MGDQDAAAASERSALAWAAGEVALARAARLARRGRYTEAAALLDRVRVNLPDGLPVEPPDGVRADSPRRLPAPVDLRARIHDLRARIHAQQGELEQADACWAEAEALAPECGRLAAGRRRIVRLRRIAGGGNAEGDTADDDNADGGSAEAGQSGWRRLAPLVSRRLVRSRR